KTTPVLLGAPRSRPMPLGIHSHPGGIFDNSPTFQRWVNEVEASPVPKGRLKGWNASDPGGMIDNSPTFQRWVNGVGASPVPKGQLKGWNASKVPSGLTCILYV